MLRQRMASPGANANLAPRIDHHCDVETLARDFREFGRVQIPNFLVPGDAESIHDCLTTQSGWSMVFNLQGKHHDTDASALDSWTEKDRRKLLDLIHQKAAAEFQYFYETLPIYDIYHRSLMQGHYVNTVFEFLNGDEFLTLMQRVTQDKQIAFADAQATRYGPGHFLTRHDDNVDGKCRRVAYVLNLSRNWSADWGGILQFFNANGNVDCGYSPSFNTLNLMRVPTEHSVSIVAPFATESRISITGWLRSGDDPMAA
ncbi:MAG: 2OG-Fe(II) oxygenase [Gammaproteobacteria bacterium]|nr:2OG-Fe(II) oxygenase [Gammaproteobacteria bacterium]